MEPFKTKKFIVDEIRRLSQDEGLTDEEISEKIGYTRVHIARIRKEYNIPKRNIGNRKDKPWKCPICKQVTYIRRNQSGAICCDECAEVISKMEHMRLSILTPTDVESKKIDTNYSL